MAGPRSSELADRLDQLAAWALAEARRCWATVDPDQVLASFAAVAPALTDLHRGLCIEALTAVDLYMFCAAADAGFAYNADWTVDFPDRPDVTYWGQPAGAAIRRAPVIVLARIAAGVDVDAAMLAGWHSLSRIYSTQAHHIARTVVRARVVADLAARGI